MKIVIGLNQADFVCLRDKIPDDSSLRQVFKPWQNDDDESGYDEFKQTGPGIPLTAEIQIHCSKEEGEQLLAFARCIVQARFLLSTRHWLGEQYDVRCVVTIQD